MLILFLIAASSDILGKGIEADLSLLNIADIVEATPPPPKAYMI